MVICREFLCNPQQTKKGKCAKKDEKCRQKL